MAVNRSFRCKNGEEIILRPAVVDDAAGIISAVSSVSAERSYIMMEHYGKDVETEKAYISSLGDRHNLLLVAQAGESIVGSLEVVQAEGGLNPQTAHVAQVGMHLISSYRDQGIGSRMLQYAVEWAKENALGKLEASIFTSNQRSLRVFKNAGFAEEGTKRKQYRIGNEFIDEVVMGIVLD